MLKERAREHYETTALALVAAIPTRADEGAGADRDPARTFFTRHADPLAKALLLAALVPQARVVEDGEGHVAVKLGERVWSLDGPSPRVLERFDGAPLAAD